MASKIFLFASLIFVGLTAGSAFAVTLGYNPASLDAASYVSMMQRAIHNLAPLGAVVNLAWISTLVSAYFVRRQPVAFWLMVAAGICTVGGAVVTVIGNWPINNQIVTWNVTSPPANWAELRDTWWRLHIVRFVLEVAGLCFLSTAVLNRRNDAN